MLYGGEHSPGRSSNDNKGQGAVDSSEEQGDPLDGLLLTMVAPDRCQSRAGTSFISGCGSSLGRWIEKVPSP